MENLFNFQSRIVLAGQHIRQEQSKSFAAITSRAKKSLYLEPNFSLLNDVASALTMFMKFATTRKTGGRDGKTRSGLRYN